MEMKRILVFCRHGADVESFFEELSSSMKVQGINKSKKSFCTEYEVFEFININSRGADGLKAHDFLLSPCLLKTGGIDLIEQAVNLGRSYTAIYP